ncbi:MAG: radical SAM protein [Clostridia bacterium]|nr:radical SAM protein [Clostridia bacterium]
MFMRMPLDISAKLYEDEVVYRPPLEAASILIDVGSGCSWSRCTFCRESAKKRYRVSDLDTIKRKIELLAVLPGILEHNKAFLLGENTLGLDTDFLLAIFAHIHKYLPHVKCVNMYGRIKEVLDKGEADLCRLKEQGLGDLYIGVESGSNRVLKMVCKGTSTAMMQRCFDLLDQVGIPYALSSVIGLGGKEHSAEHAIATARFYNGVHPKSIRIMTLTPVRGTVLYDQVQEGKFTELTPDEVLLEERLFLEYLEVENCLLIGTHISNNVPLLGRLPEDKEKLKDILDEAIVSHDPSYWQKRDFENF